VRIAGEIKGFDASKYIDGKELRRTARVSQVSVAAAQEAYLTSALEIGKDVQHDRVGVVMGTAMGGFEMSESALAELRTGYRKMNPFALPAALPNAPGHHISKAFGAKGILSTVVAACASGTQSIGDAAEMIRRGKADAMFAGGVEAVVNESALAGFSLMRVLSTYNDEPTKAQRPFDVTRNGFVYSEGCVVMLLESLEIARARGAHIYAEVLGMGVSSDAHHIAIPDPTGSGAVRAMQWAIEDAGIRAEEVDYVNAHGSATETNDPLETKAIKQVFGERAYDIPVSSTKSMTGHAMGASGSIEALATVMSLKTGILTPTINLNNPDPECDLDYVPNTARRDDIQIAVSNSFGLGGQNASIVLARYEE
jgi:beta-ketoacyl-acyl-carrier-protein synthase II